jgi:hypothetical protein
VYDTDNRTHERSVVHSDKMSSVNMS